MKRLYFFIVTLLFISTTYALNPIPSYNTPVNGVVQFKEVVSGMFLSDERRELDVESPNPTFGPAGMATVYAYRVDGSRVLGPFTLTEGGMLRIKIDGKAWGVTVNSNSPMLVSVYITSGTAENRQTENNYLNYSSDTWGFNYFG